MEVIVSVSTKWGEFALLPWAEGMETSRLNFRVRFQPQVPTLLRSQSEQ